jgi:hypothetical protein
LITNDFTVSQGGARLVVAGSLALESKNTDFTATASLEPSLARATGLEGKSITVAGIGQVTSPKLSLKDFPLDFASDQLSSILGTTPDTLRSLQTILGDGDGALENIEEQLEDAAGVELPEGVGGLFREILDSAREGEAPAVEPDPEAAVPAPKPEPAPVDQPAQPAPVRAQPLEP